MTNDVEVLFTAKLPVTLVVKFVAAACMPRALTEPPIVMAPV